MVAVVMNDDDPPGELLMTGRRLLLTLVFTLCAAVAAAPSLTTAAPPEKRVFEVDGKPTDPAFFPIAVWLQSPRNAERYKEAGINLYMALWRGPNQAQLSELKAAGMPVICDQNKFALEHLDDPTFAAWMHGDEPDNAQSLPNGQGYGPPIKPSVIVASYEELRAKDPTRPVVLNLGQGVANDAWKGRGAGASLDDYPQYVKGADIVSFDVYPVAGVDSPEKLWLVPFGIERLQKWTGGSKILWNCVECTRISNLERKPTPDQVKAEVWMALAQGSQGLIYFVHQFEPKFNEHALLDDPEMLAEVTALNKRVQALAPVLNSPILAGAGTVASSDPEVPIAMRVHRHEGVTYVIAANLRNTPIRGTLSLKDLTGAATAEVLDEARTIPVDAGRFDDGFAPFESHVYRIKPAA